MLLKANYIESHSDKSMTRAPRYQGKAKLTSSVTTRIFSVMKGMRLPLPSCWANTLTIPSKERTILQEEEEKMAVINDLSVSIGDGL